MRRILLGAGAAAFVLAAGCGQEPAQAHGDEDHGGEAAAEASSTEAASDDSAAPALDAPTGAYITDYKHRYITFSYDHQGYSFPYVRWRDWTGALEWNAEDPEQSSVFVTIDVASVDSGVDEFDDHLRSADFFDAATHPTITFESTEVHRASDNTGHITGDLTIKEITKPVTLDVVFNKAETRDDGSAKLGFSAKTTVKRSDFGVDKYVPFVGDDVTVIIEAEFVPPPAE